MGQPFLVSSFKLLHHNRFLKWSILHFKMLLKVLSGEYSLHIGSLSELSHDSAKFIFLNVNSNLLRWH